ncbi:MULTISPECIES: ethanolamine ammonia-lyase subunit EutC [Roseomonadaceae]|uniref:Ethanolamine ammonia-lyase small subunit n=1 Tax=Falsiroseomonas oleicola TaxID=2801474 RepID=A0ABS6HA29_9PROT|nr:ethanolamine ammonia-lyase subunit EutC [Roseomonas oleicola]MBU8544677.1 ethanolamine ammonia-lyase subunit EutC [Roseomonas oleicola]
MSAPVLWRDLRRHTAARVGLGRVGNGLPTAAHLDFQEAHAQARDAVWSVLDVPALQAALGAEVVASAAPDRRTYLLRPDLGRRMAEGLSLAPRPGCFAIVVADGLCATGVQAQAPALAQALTSGLRAAGWDVAPPVIATQARVAIGDAIGAALGAAMVAVLIGERPGLSALDSMGIYLTHAPRPGRSDAERNCISNIRPGGLSVAEASAKLLWLVQAARDLGATGVALKDEQPVLPLLEDQPEGR